MSNYFVLFHIERTNCPWEWSNWQRGNFKQTKRKTDKQINRQKDRQTIEIQSSINKSRTL